MSIIYANDLKYENWIDVVNNNELVNKPIVNKNTYNDEELPNPIGRKSWGGDGI